MRREGRSGGSERECTIGLVDDELEPCSVASAISIMSSRPAASPTEASA